ncbi:unnamed protein product [Boreogadus saida]
MKIKQVNHLWNGQGSKNSNDFQNHRVALDSKCVNQTVVLYSPSPFVYTQPLSSAHAFNFYGWRQRRQVWTFSTTHAILHIKMLVQVRYGQQQKYVKLEEDEGRFDFLQFHEKGLKPHQCYFKCSFCKLRNVVYSDAFISLFQIK